jgi:hypothetical protein
MINWQPVATIPHDGRMVLVYRPLAARSNDEPIAIKQTETENRWCWPCTVPDGATPTNPTNGACHVTHWAKLTAPPNT